MSNSSGLLSIRANNYLGSDYEDYLTLVQALTSDPITYNKARSVVLKNLKRNYIILIKKF